MKTLAITTTFVTLLAAAGCVAPVGVGGPVSIPPNAAATCAGQCSSIGMELSAVAIMANNVGCVCQRREGTASTGGSVGDQTGATAAGMATIAMQEEEAQQRQRQQHHQQQQQQQQQQTRY